MADTGGRTLAPERSTAAVALDNLIRRRLRVSDPANPAEIAFALERAYPGETIKLAREQQGLPFATISIPDAWARPVGGAVRTDADEVQVALERDLRAIDASPLLSEIQPELRGWAMGVRTSFATGLAAARQGADPQKREATFACRRTLAEFARLIRFAGALTPSGSELFRQLARSIDDASAVMLVALGTSLERAGQLGTRFLLQSPVAGLQQRRDAVLLALHGLLGLGRENAAPDGWPRGVLALRQVSTYLQANGFGDLEPLLDESYLARQLDSLVEAASNDDPDGVRSLAPSAEPTLNGLRRLVLVSRGSAFPQSPTLEAFRVALQHFIDPFDPALASVGYRIPFVSRAPLLIGRITGLGALDAGTLRLVDLARLRLVLADEIDNYLAYAYGNEQRVLEQVCLDACLQCFDAAIDRYALGVDAAGDGPAEWRAAAYGYLAYIIAGILPADQRSVNVFLALRQMYETLIYFGPHGPPGPAFPAPPAPPPAAGLPGPPFSQAQQAIGEELALQGAAEIRWFDAARSLAPTFVLFARAQNASPVLPFIELARVAAAAPIVPANFVADVPRDVATLLEVII